MKNNEKKRKHLNILKMMFKTLGILNIVFVLNLVFIDINLSNEFFKIYGFKSSFQGISTLDKIFVFLLIGYLFAMFRKIWDLENEILIFIENIYPYINMFTIFIVKDTYTIYYCVNNLKIPFIVLILLYIIVNFITLLGFILINYKISIIDKDIEENIEKCDNNTKIRQRPKRRNYEEINTIMNEDFIDTQDENEKFTNYEYRYYIPQTKRNMILNNIIPDFLRKN